MAAPRPGPLRVREGRNLNGIEVYADVGCPFAHVGLQWMRRRRDELGRDDVVLVVRAWPLELVNGRPQDAQATLRHVEALRAQVAPDLFGGFDPARFPASTIGSLTLAAAAYRRDTRLGELVSLKLRSMLFDEGIDVSDARVLADLALRHGLSPDEADRRRVHEEWHTGQARGVLGSPHFFCGQSDAFCPSLDVAADGSGPLLVRQRLDRLVEFFDACAGTPPD